MRHVAIAAVLGILLALPSAGAQTTDTQVEVTVEDLPTEPIVLESDSSAEAPFVVRLEAENFACTEEGTLPVELGLTAEPGSVDNFTLDPTLLEYTVSTGTYSSSNPVNQTMDVTFAATVEGEVPSNHTHEPSVEATFLPDEVQGCSSATGFPDASDSGSFTIEMVAPPDDGGSGGGDGGGGGGDGASEDDGNGIPGPGAAAALAALLAAGRARRRS